MLKQVTQTCICGQAMKFPEGEIKAKCSCGAHWELGPEGYWYTQSMTTTFTPILTSPVVSPGKSRSDRYRNYPKNRQKKKGRKAGRKW